VETYYRPFTFLGLLLIASGVILVLLPVIARYIPSIERVPWIILWVYKSDGFYFATSPLLIILSVLSLVLNVLGRGR